MPSRSDVGNWGWPPGPPGEPGMPLVVALTLSVGMVGVLLFAVFLAGLEWLGREGGGDGSVSVRFVHGPGPASAPGARAPAE